MPKHTFLVENLRAGVVTYTPYQDAPRNSLRKAKNCLFDRAGYLKRRPGLQQMGGDLPDKDFHTGPKQIWAMTGAGFLDNRKLFVVIFDSSLSPETYAAAWDGTSWRNADSGAVIGDGQLPLQAQWVRESDGTEYVYYTFLNGSGTPSTSVVKVDIPASGTNLTTGTVSGQPTGGGRLIAMHMDRAWLAGNVRADSREKLFYSNALEPETWPAANTISFDGEAVTAISSFRDTLLMVGTEVSLHLIAVGASTNLLDWEKRTISSDIGVGSGASVAQGLEDVFFVDQNLEVRSLARTLAATTANIASVPISLPVKDKIEGIGDYSKDAIVGAFLKNRYHLFGHTESTIDGSSGQSWVFDSSIGAWTGPMVYALATTGLDVGSNVTAAVTTMGGFGDSSVKNSRTSNLHLALKHSNDGEWYVYEYDESIYEDDDVVGGTNTTIDVDIESQIYDFGFPQQDKTISYVEVEYGDEDTAFSGVGSWVFYWKRDFEETWREAHTEHYDTGTKIKTVKITLDETHRGRTFQFRWVDQSATDGPKLRRFWIRFQAHDVDD